MTFMAQANGTLNEVSLEHASSLGADTPSDTHTINLFISEEPAATPEQSIASASATGTFVSSKDPRGDSYTLVLDRPIEVESGAQYYLHLGVDSGVLSITGASIANETDYDWSLPFRVDGFDPFGGMYRGDLLLQVYWDDNPEKLTRFVDTLSQTDYIFIPTNHQYAQITRLPERYPLTTLYYRELLGCPRDQEIIDCYYPAQPGQYKGNLGFELVKVFESYPTLGPIVINDQRAEEAFTFYDHPKVLIFKKTDDFSSEKVREVLGSVDLTQAVHLTPRQFSNYMNLMLPLDRLMQQRAGGTWSQWFDYDWVQNKYPIVGLLVWYVFIFLLGLLVYPMVRLAFPGLWLYGYPLSRALGLVLLAWMSWMGGSLSVPYTRFSIGAALALIAVAGLSL